MKRRCWVVRVITGWALGLAAAAGASAAEGDPLAGTAPLERSDDPVDQMLAEADRFLDGKIEAAVAERTARWDREADAGRAAFAAFVEQQRGRLAWHLGVREAEAPPAVPELLREAVVARGEGLTISAVRWRAFGEVFAEGLLIEPEGSAPRGDAVWIPDADRTPEAACGWGEETPPAEQGALAWARDGYRVLVVALVSRGPGPHGLTRREFLHRPAFELGRTLTGYEIRFVQAGIDWLAASREGGDGGLPVRVGGTGEGGRVAWFAAALDPRITEADVRGAASHPGGQAASWDQPAERNHFGLLAGFGDREIAAMILPRRLAMRDQPAPVFEVAAGGRGKPGRLGPVPAGHADRVLAEARALVARAGIAVAPAGAGTPDPGTGDDAGGSGERPDFGAGRGSPAERDAARQARLVSQLDGHTQDLLEECEAVREQAFWAALDLESVEAFERSAEPLREAFAREVIGEFGDPLVEPAARTRRIDVGSETVEAFEVALDVFDGWSLHGVLLRPRGIASGERRPVVVCQHGLEGRPADTFSHEGGPGWPYYHGFARRLAERGFVTFAPQHLYIGGDRFRALQFKLNPLGKTLFSLMVPQHRQLVRWLATLDFVDPGRLGFYGLSYGGKSAMRIPPLVPEYAAVICSADFNDWIWKNASTRSRYSYVRTGEYEIFEYDLGNRCNYAEMAALVAPRPFMVERGHFDGVAPDERVAYEFARVRHLYQARLGLGDRAEIEWFVGPHTIHGEGTFRFLHRHLDWPEPAR